MRMRIMDFVNVGSSIVKTEPNSASNSRGTVQGKRVYENSVFYATFL